MSGKKVNIVLVLKSGGDFTIKDLFLLSSNLYKTTRNIQIHCITDIISRDVTLQNVKLIPMQNEWPGWWSKLNLFSPELEYLRPFLYFDLDTVILKDISDIIPKQDDNSFIALRDWYHPRVYNSSMLWIANNKKIDEIWSRWIAEEKISMKRFRSDQDFMYFVTTPDKLWQDYSEKICNFKPNKKWRYEYPADMSIVCFHGKPRILEARKSVKWVNDYVYGK